METDTIECALLGDSTPQLGGDEALRQRWDDDGVLHFRGIIDPKLMAWGEELYGEEPVKERLIDPANPVPVLIAGPTNAWRPLRRVAANEPLREFAAHCLTKHAPKLGRKHKRLAKMPVSERHALRIEVKKLRYAAEFFTGLFAALDARQSKQRFVKTLGRLQESLGALNDMAVAAGNAGNLFADVEPIAAAGLEVQLGDLLKPSKKQAAKMLRRSAKALAKIGGQPAWWKSGLATKP